MSAQDRLAAIIAEHHAVDVDSSPEGDVIECRCGWSYTVPDHAAHVAAVIAWSDDLAVIPVDDTVTISYGVVLDDLGSTDYYETLDEAVADAYGGQVVKVYTVPVEEVSRDGE